MSARIALVTTDLRPFLSATFHGDDDRAPIADALSARGAEVRHPEWGDATVPWDDFDLIVLRSPWDYSDRSALFLAWLEALDPTRVLNEPALIGWNLDKRYLTALDAAGVNVVPTRYVTHPAEFASALESLGSNVAEVVVKPTVSAGSRNTGRFAADDPAAESLVRTIVADDQVAMVQPAIRSVATDGEIALMFIDGEFSHAVRKGPILGDGGTLLGGSYTETITAEQPQPDVADTATAAAGAVRSIREAELGLIGDPLYARYDIVLGDDGPLLLEAELFEPSLFVDTAPGSADRFAAAVLRRVSTDSLGRPVGRHRR